ncbi:aminodeoxychorismate synthase, component I [Bacillus sp. MCCB 382]|uniref:aminodeoxychorismate synthase, component I n=1 Tax=Bacillus sp. MCCB 382 TaxID=2860197 RepID=UPI001C59825E|nr:aminodeoxychorismate synthase, component I [Bacillus sp. MCCB 382]
MQHLYFHKNHSTKEQFFAAYEQLSQQEIHHILLESGRGGRYSVAGLRPDVILQSVPEGLEIQDLSGTETILGDPLIQLEKWMEPLRTERRKDLPDFQGGVIGFISYDYARKIESLPSLGRDDLEIPELYFYYLKQWVVFDHEENCMWTMILSDEEPELAETMLAHWTGSWMDALSSMEVTGKPPVHHEPAEIEVSMGEGEFSEAVKKIQSYISDGDVFQVNLSVRQSQQLKVEPYRVYQKLRELNPSPYMSYIHSPDFQIVSGSPELLVKKKGTEVSTRPIAGTRSRGKDAEEDERLASELINNEKERAEHVMLVDLERNDLGRVCQYGTVEVDEFMVIEKYSHVMHIVSNVRGTLDETKTGADLIRSVFPGGTITGAPKVRTMEIIEELEPVRRGIYTGSIGWIGVNGDMELNIVIRTMLVKEGKGHIQAGAGVVIDSNPAYEYKESLKKAKALWVAKAMAEGENL